MRINRVDPSDDAAVAEVVHDLCLPLSIIKGFVTALRRTDVEWDDETQRDYLAEIDREADRIAAILETLLDSVRPNHGAAHQLTQQIADPAAVVNGAIQGVGGSLGTPQAGAERSRKPGSGGYQPEPDGARAREHY
jgi:signal transduction histidine kinase